MDNHELVSVNLTMLIKLAKPAASLKLFCSRVRALHSGGYISKLKGRGMEFDEVRPYQTGDDIRSIDWRVTARTGKTHTKLFREERERPVFISVDYRRSMQFATRGVFKAVQAAKLATLLAWVAQVKGDRLGGQIFTDESCQELKPQNGKHAVLHFLNALVKPDQNLHDTVDLASSMARLTQHVRAGSVIYIISDFRGINKDTEQSLAYLSKHCEVMMLFIYDPLELQLPKKGQYRITHEQSDLTINTRDEQRVKQYQQKFQQHRDYLKALTARLNIRLIECATTENPVNVLR